MNQYLNELIKVALRQKGIVVINEGDQNSQQICIQEGLAMLVIPKSITLQEKLTMLKKYDGIKLIFTEHCENHEGCQLGNE